MLQFCLRQNDRCVVIILDYAAVCLCQDDRCVVIVHRQCYSMFVSERLLCCYCS